ncbi:hypothetical protein F2Q69_00020785 [Brassica cretica]|uniref:Uncharacterized protein n=1 Tax=Brassica cretica TaxID=69181 RepID=A0A8S9Q9Z8_BRACR|nr:hypothetical protein F2Q69_00020785 [Brassica cretica]
MFGFVICSSFSELEAREVCDLLSPPVLVYVCLQRVCLCCGVELKGLLLPEARRLVSGEGLSFVQRRRQCSYVGACTELLVVVWLSELGGCGSDMSSMAWSTIPLAVTLHLSAQVLLVEARRRMVDSIGSVGEACVVETCCREGHPSAIEDYLVFLVDRLSFFCSHPWRYAIYVMFVLKRLQLLQLEREWDASALSRINLIGEELLEEKGLRREKRRCLEASLLAWWTRWSQPPHRDASSAVQNTDASSLSQTSHLIFISRID